MSNALRIGYWQVIKFIAADIERRGRIERTERAMREYRKLVERKAT